LLVEPRRPAESFWDEVLISSRLIEYEVWNRIHHHRLAAEVGETARALLGRVNFFELSPLIVERALDPFPVAVRTLDALHLATAHYAREQGAEMRLASYDSRMIAAARAIGIEPYDL
jgi:hypothetical protein